MTHVLVIDHDRQLCQQLNEHLIREGLTVRFAHDGLSGLASALSGLHDVVVVDEGVPELFGIQLIRRLRIHSAIGVLLLGARRGGQQDRRARVWRRRLFGQAI